MLQKDEEIFFCNKQIVSETRPLFEELTDPKFISYNKAKVSATRASFQELSTGADRADRTERIGSYARDLAAIEAVDV